MASVFAYLSAALVAVWGVAHAIPTSKVVAGFEPTSDDNRRVIVQEWLAEALAMWGLATVIFVTTAVIGVGAESSHWMYRVVAGILIAFALLTALTGARTAVIWFKICPVLLTVSAIGLIAASLL